MTDEETRYLKVDLHVHSRFSRQPANWFLKKMGFNESYTDPFHIYQTAKAKGMSAVTISDHDTIEGVSTISHQPDVFLSEEVSAIFPEDNFCCHVLALDITPVQHEEIQRLKSNIYELLEYMRQANILHVIAHPLFTGNSNMNIDRFEKMLLLFKHMEINGARNPVQNQAIEFVTQHLTSKDIERLSDKHKIEPAWIEPWKKILVAGSDDHSGLNIARTHTITPCDDAATDGVTATARILCSIREGMTIIATTAPSPHTFARNLYAIGFQRYKEKMQIERMVKQDRVLEYIDSLLTAKPCTDTGMWHNFVKTLRERQEKRNHNNGQYASTFAMLKVEAGEILRKEQADSKKNSTYPADWHTSETALFDFSKKLTNRTLEKTVTNLMENLTNGAFFSVINSFGALASLYTALGPYFAAYSLFARDKGFSREVVSNFCKDEDIPRQQCIRVAHFTDTFFEINGVATTLQQQASIARLKKKHLKIITCSDKSPELFGCVKVFAPVGCYQVPEYPDQALYIPPLLELLDYCYEKEFTHIHAATPGFMGLVAMVIARILDLPLHGTYHTAFPEYARHLTGDPSVEVIVAQYMTWFYNQLDVVFAPSRTVAEDLKQLGIKREKIKIYPRGIDTQRFNPAMRNGFLKRHYSLEDGLKILYVGRISKEKNLDLLAEAFKELASRLKDVHLVLVGEGPYKEELKDRLKGTNTLFTGQLHGDALSAAYASCDLFVFPSTTDTFGNVVLEAQASGLPVIVTDVGGPKENIIPRETGLVVNHADPSNLASVMTWLLSRPNELKAMGQAARRYSEQRSFENAFDESWQLYAKVSPSSLC